jgi:hypothetical protein
VGFDYGTTPSAHLQSASTLAVRLLYGWPELFPDDQRWDLNSYSVLPDREKLRGHECIVLRNLFTDRERIIMWLDQDYMYVPLCVRNLFRGDDGDWYVGWEWEIYFRRDEERTHPVISHWHAKGVNRSGVLLEESTAECESITFNCDPPDSEFTFEFPAGTLISNSADEYYILREDGTKRHITWDEEIAHVPYRRLLETESGTGHLNVHSQGRQRMRVYIVAAGCLAVCVLAVFSLFKRRRRM